VTDPTNPYNQPQPIVIRQETSPGTKVGIWVLVGLIGGPIIIFAVCCLGLVGVGFLGEMGRP
jgi:hypothetical protein